MTAEGLWPVRRALLSASDKAGLSGLAAGLAARGVEVVSTGRTAAYLRGAGVAVTEVADVTGLPEMLGGRVKTLHPAVHGGLLARRGEAGDMAALAGQGWGPIDLLAVTLYPFEAAVAQGAGEAEAVEEIDVGGPAMIRAAAKNHAHVAALTDPEDYAEVLAELAAHDGATTLSLRRRLAARAFGRTAAYDAAIAGWLDGDDPAPRRRVLAGTLAATLRYGENPHQRGAFYRTGEAEPSVATAAQVGGKALSYNNIADADAALALVAEVGRDGPACVVVKHGGPCGVALGRDGAEAHAKALACDPVSAFGGVVAFSRPLDGAAARAVAEVFTEVVVAPEADDEARAVLAGKPTLRLMLTGGLPDARAQGLAWTRVGGGFLVQDRDAAALDEGALRVATARAPTPEEMADLRFAWAVAKHARSNAIVLARGGATVGIGAGRTSRVDSVRQAADQLRARGGPAVMASDAFFPFADGVEEAAAAGVTAAIQPGGSLRDAEVVAAADRLGLSMVLTGTRHFRH